MCRIFGVSTSGYYDSVNRQPCTQQVKRRAVAQAAAHSYFESNRVYGYRKVYDDVIETVGCCQEMVRRVMREIGLFSRIKRKFIVTTNSNHTLSIAANILNRNFIADKPNLKWVADITYIPTKQGWLYLAVVLDLFSRKIVGWSMSSLPLCADRLSRTTTSPFFNVGSKNFSVVGSVKNVSHFLL
jgi:putative transposase